MSRLDGGNDEVEVDLAPAAHLAAIHGVNTTVHPSTGSRNLRRGRCARCLRRRSVRTILRTVNVALIVVFLASAILQYNDEDGVLWAALYFAAAMLSALAELSWGYFRVFFVIPAMWLFVFLATIGALYVLIAELLIPQSSGGVSDSEAYEFAGSALVSVWTALLLLFDRCQVVGVFRSYASLGSENERDKEGNLQMGEVVL